MSKRTEEAYVRWITEFLRFHKKNHNQWIHPDCLNSHDVNRYLTHLAVNRNVSASTQNQALSAILFLYNKILDRKLDFDAVRAKTPERVPVVLSVDEYVY